MEFNLEQEKKDLIKENIIKNEQFKNNEDLYDKIFEETLKRGFFILKNMDIEDTSTEVYIRKIISSSIVHILEQENRVESKNTSTDEPKENSLNNKYSHVKIDYDFEYQPIKNDIQVSKNLIQKISETVIVANTKNPEKEFLKIYHMRYVKKLSLNEIAKSLNLSRDIISNNLFELMEIVSKELE